MTYATRLSEEIGLQRFLIVMRPRKRIQTWTLVSGFIYRADFAIGKPSSVEVDSVQMTEVTTSSPSASQWYWDSANARVILRCPQSDDPTGHVVCGLYPIYVGTQNAQDSAWYSDPLDSTTAQVYYEPIISEAPQIKSTTSDSLFGYIPTQSSSVKLINAEHILEKHIYDSSFNNASIKIYHCLGPELAIADIKQVYDGLMSDIQWNDDQVQIKCVDRIDEFSTEYRNASESFYNTTLFPNLNPIFIGKPIRYVYGRVEGFVPVNVDYVENSPTTSDNRDWCVIGEQTGLGEISRTVVGASSTTTRTYINFTEGLNVGDTVWLDKAVDKYFEITAIDRAASYIDHAAVAGVPVAGDLVKRGFVSKVEIEQDGVIYTAMYNRDYTCGTLAGGSSGFSFTTSLESNTGMLATLSANDKVYCTVYGRVNDLTAGGPTFGADDPTNTDISTLNLANPIMVLYDLMKTRMGMGESRLNLTTFASVRSSTASQGVGIAIPDSSQGSMPTYKTIAINLLRTCLTRLFLDGNNKWSLALLQPLQSVSVSATNEEIYQGVSYDFAYSDVVSDILVTYAPREVGELLGTASTTKQVVATSMVGKHLHKINHQKTFESLHMRASDAQILANRLSYVLGERQGTISFKSRNKFFSSLLNDTIEIEREKLPGFDFVSGTSRTRDFSIVSASKSLRGVSIDADDQKGIQDNSGSW